MVEASGQRHGSGATSLMDLPSVVEIDALEDVVRDMVFVEGGRSCKAERFKVG